MKLKDIAYYCLFTYDPSISAYSLQKNRSQEYYWVINGLIYQIDGVESYCSPVSWNDGCQYYCCENNSYTNILHLSKYRNCDTNDRNNHLTVNLDNEITIFDKFILVHQTTREITPSENQIFTKNHYCVANGHEFSSDSYTIGLYKKDPLHYLSDISEERLVFCPIETNLRTLFKDLIDPPVQPKPAELTLDEKVDDLISSLIPEDKINEPIAWVVTSENGVERPTCITEQQAIAVANSLKYHRESLKVVPLYEHPPKMKDSRTMAIKKLKRMLNERL